MALITRVSRLLRADLHAVLDHIEEPDTLLRQAIREMEEDLAQDEQRIKRMRHEHAQLTTRAADAERSQRDLEQELDVCFECNEEKLARELIRRRLETQRFAKFLSRKLETLAVAIAELETRIQDNRTRLESMRQKAEVLIDEEPREPAEQGWSVPDFTVRDEDVEVAFLREKRRRQPA